jgi:WD40 repeat protein
MPPSLFQTGCPALPRSIEVVDVTTMQCSSTIEDTHARPPHAIVQSASSSLLVSLAKEAYELFATASQDNTAKLWDVRSCRCVRTFTGHKNSQVATNIAFSPCLR